MTIAATVPDRMLTKKTTTVLSPPRMSVTAETRPETTPPMIADSSVATVKRTAVFHQRPLISARERPSARRPFFSSSSSTGMATEKAT